MKKGNKEEMAVSSSASVHSSKGGEHKPVDRIKLLYPAVNEMETPLPRSWNSKDKYNFIGLSQNNLRVHYKGHGKTHKDAASVRATHPIPPSCGLYYFEVKIVSKGRDGYMGIGLSASGVNMNRLPGWDKHSYGYHGDDGHSFCSSGTGQPYGPTFTTGDVIGCGVNLIDNTAFYTKNGHHLGIAFTDLPPNLYPTVGLQTPGEVVDTNFGQMPFVFDVEEMMKELRAKIKNTIIDYPLKDNGGQTQSILQKMVSQYLVHHGYCATAEAFAHETGQTFDEETVSIKDRQRILKLVLNGKIGEAIEATYKTYPGLLEHNRNLLLMLKCRQFIEMVNGTEHSEVFSPRCHRMGSTPPYQQQNSGASCSPPLITTSASTSSRHSSSLSPSQPTSVIQSTKSLNINNTTATKRQNDLVMEVNTSGPASVLVNGTVEVEPQQQTTTTIKNGVCNDVEMVLGEKMNGSCMSNGYQNGAAHFDDCDVEEMDIDPPINTVPSCKKQCSGGNCNNSNSSKLDKILDFGRELFTLGSQLRQEFGKNEKNKRMLQNAFSLLAYSDPSSSSVGWQLHPSQRESVCAMLNSAILESSNMARHPPLDLAVAHAKELITLMSNSGLGSCAFANFDKLLFN